MIKRLGKCIGNLLQLVNIVYCILVQHKRSSFFPFRWEVSFWAMLSWICAATWVSGQPGLRTSGNSRSYPPVPCLCHGVKELLTIMDFSFVYFSESMLCFCLPRRGPCSSISFHHSSSSHIFFNLFPLCLPSWNHIPSCHCSVLLHFLFFSQSAHRCANPSYNYNGAWLKLI